MILFYTTEIKENHAVLNQEETRHCTHVLRKQLGDIIQLVDGKGNFYEARIIEISKKACLVEIIETIANFNSRDFYLHIGIAPTKNMDRLEWFVEKATEIGIDEITPILCQRSERKKLRIDRLEKKALSAMKQSLKASLPIIHELTPFKEAIQQSPDISLRLVAQGGQKKSLKDNYTPNKAVYILIGPEGDFTDTEKELAFANGFQGVHMGNSRLRTETAGLVACHTVNLLNEGI